MVLGTFLVLSLDDSRCMCAGCLSTLGFSARMKVGGLEVDLLYVLFIYLFIYLGFLKDSACCVVVVVVVGRGNVSCREDLAMLV